MRAWLTLVVMLSIIVVPFAASGQQKAVAIAIAPADEYFGKQGLSVLGIHNQLKLLYERLDSDAFGKSELIGAENVEDAIRDWAQRYPQDNWLDRYAVDLERLYSRIQMGEGRMRLAGFAEWIHLKFPGQAVDTDCLALARATFALPGDATPVPVAVVTVSPEPTNSAVPLISASAGPAADPQPPATTATAPPQ